jgi:rfaE bifunctional protein nucleotidyltransferase chain/domain
MNLKLLNPLSRLESCLDGYHKLSIPLAFTNGCFDVLHAGHVEFLAWAKEQTGKLVHGRGSAMLLVALNTDESVQRLKGSSRPINIQEDRAAVVAALSSVDLVTFFYEDTPYELLGRVKPALILKSSQYRDQDTPERRYARENGIDLLYGPYRPELSTTNILRHELREKDCIEKGQAQCGLSPAARLNLITDTSNFLYGSTESFEEEQVGADLAYLLNAIASGGGVCEWPEDRPIVKLLRKGKPKDHEIWCYIEIEKEE